MHVEKPPRQLAQSTIRKYELRARKEAELSRTLPTVEEAQQFTREDWQEAISVKFNEVHGSLKTHLDLFGVALVHDFLQMCEADVLNGSVIVAKLLAEKGGSPLQVRTISGGTSMIDVSSRWFQKGHPHFDSAANTLQSVNEKLQRLVGDGFEIVGDLSILTTPNGSDKQLIHSDNIVRNRYNGLLVLSDDSTPTVFLPKQYRNIAFHSAPVLEPNGRVMRTNERSLLKEKYSLMFEPLENLESKMSSVSATPLKRGDLLLFEADMLHRGDENFQKKTLLFFICALLLHKLKRMFNSMQDY